MVRKLLLSLSSLVPLALGPTRAEEVKVLADQNTPFYSIFTAFLATARSWAEGDDSDQEKLQRLMQETGIAACAEVADVLQTAAAVEEVYDSVPPGLKPRAGESTANADALARARAQHIVGRLGGVYAQFLTKLSRAGCKRQAVDQALRTEFAGRFGLTTFTDDAAFVRELDNDFLGSAQRSLGEEP